MNQAPLVLGINRAQDASVCLMRGSQLVWAVQKERLTRQPRHRGCSGDLAAIYKPRLPELEQRPDVLVESHAADAGPFEAELAATLALAPGCRRALLSRHLAHVYSVFQPSPFARAAVMVVNSHGSQVADFTEHWRGSAAVPGHWHEVASFYHADRERITCIDKQVWNRDQQQLVGLGMFYFLLTQAIFPGRGNQAKVMQLAPHGNPGALGLPPLHVEAWQVTIPAAWRNILRETARFCYGAPGHARFSDSAALAAAGQRAFEDALVKVAHWLHRQTGADALCLAGGSALNCTANQRLLRDTPFKRLCVAPAPGAAGTALGCALYGLTELARLPCNFRWQANYLGPQPAAAAIDAALAAAPDLLVERPPELCARVCDLLCQGQVLGLFQGRSEFGPRALGHRSILADPRHAHLRDWINASVKQREWFRPLFPVVLLEHAGRYFDIPQPSPCMQYAAPVHPEAAASVPAIGHGGGAARLQTVGPDDDPFLRRLLLMFADRTGVPMLINTSLRAKDQPMAETPAEALDTLRSTPLHALAMPPYLIRKRVQPEAAS